MKKRLIALCLALAFVLAALPGNLVSLAADSLGDLGVQPNQGAANGEQSGENASDGVVINNGVTGEVTDSEGNPVLDANGKPLQVVVGGDLPEGSTVQATDHSSTTSDENVGILDVKLNDGDGNKWQPAPGETVQVGVPVAADADRVTVVHFIEDPEIIKWALENGKAEKYDVSEFAEDENFGIIESAVKAYQTACNTTDLYVVVEQFDNVAVVNGVAVVDAQGFSAFTSVPPEEIVVAGEVVFPDYNWGSKTNEYSVRIDEWIQINGTVIFGNIRIVDGEEYADVIQDSNTALFGQTGIYVHIKNDPAYAGKSVTLQIGYTGRYIKLNIVNDFDYGNLYIGVVDHNKDYPNEVAVYNESAPDWFYDRNGNLVANKSINRLTPGTLINLNDVKQSNALVFNNLMTVYGVADNTGKIIEGFLKKEDNVGQDDVTYDGLTDIMASIKTAYFEKYPDLNPDNYDLIPYVVKHETIGVNTGWYVNFKVELTASFKLSYDYNVPVGFNPIDHLGVVKKPNDKAVATHDEDGNELAVVTTTVDPCLNISSSNPIMVLSKTEGNKTYTANFLGWSKNPNATAEEYEVGDEIILTGDLTLYAVWSDAGMEYNSAEVTFQNMVYHPGVGYVSNNDAFTFQASSNLANYSYTVYNAAGIKQRDGQFTDSDLNVTLKGGEYIVIDDVLNGNYSFTLMDYNEAAYTPDTSPLAFGFTAESNTSGRYIATFVNTLKQYNVTFKLDNGEADVVVGYYYGDTIVMPADPARENYVFLGWDGEVHSTMPAKDLTYTAQWKLNVTSMTISKTGCDTIDVNQSFIFRVVGDDVDMLVAVQGNGQVTIGGLIVGKTYTVTQQNWSWRYEVVETSITLGETGNVVEMAGDRTNKQWLDGNHSEINVFDGDLTK